MIFNLAQHIVFVLSLVATFYGLTDFYNHYFVGFVTILNSRIPIVEIKKIKSCRKFLEAKSDFKEVQCKDKINTLDTYFTQMESRAPASVVLSLYCTNIWSRYSGTIINGKCKFGKSTEPRLLDSLERQGLVIYTPSREIQGRMITSYDDRYIVQCAAEFDGVIVSGDYYRDLMMENPRWRTVIENRLLQFTWVGDMIMFPRDPLGRNGPTLEQFLKHP